MNTTEKSIYLDYAAATPLSDKALMAMTPYFSEKFYNPGSPYLPAKFVRDDYEEKKSQLAHIIGAKSDDLIITSGATESNNLALTAVSESGKILFSATEHDSVRVPAKFHGGREIKVKPDGALDLDDLRKNLDDETELISVALVNNELGTIQPIAEIAELVKSERLRRRLAGISRPIFLMSDASQALNLLEISVGRLGVDLLTFNSAKMYGPKGIGALYHSRETRLHPLILGGGQEQNFRSGTENVPALVGFSVAAGEARSHLTSSRKNFQHLKRLFQKTLTDFSEITPLFLGNPKKQLANFSPVSFPGLDAERLIYLLESAHVYVSTGAACAASKGEKSHVLKACGFSDDIIQGSLRITFGKDNTEEDIILAAKKIATAVNSERTRLNV
ncbi:MAG: cysteine desulfurase family protein [Candidatus Saccharibacteria bacterium]|nr:cysteine desulfurase family protein [Candidatus Saccharibacteria bacterium]